MKIKNETVIKIIGFIEDHMETTFSEKEREERLNSFDLFEMILTH